MAKTFKNNFFQEDLKNSAIHKIKKTYFASQATFTLSPACDTYTLVKFEITRDMHEIMT